MRFRNSFKDLTKFEMSLWFISLFVVILSFVFSKGGDYMTLAASLIGVTALIFVAKGYVIGQVLTVVFALFYGIISFFFRYYGEMLTYMCMTAPIAVMAVVSWIRHPFEGTKEVEVRKMDRKEVLGMFALSIAVTVVFYFILGALDTANLFFSTISVTTSFLACYLTYMRNPFYALAYAANDIVLIVLWILASIEDISYLPMIFCFVMFFANDIYGFYNWKRMERRQKGENLR
ncbi:MAG: nicotinamide mononucleotide transporter [Clostridia bacterium]|nr:nicotinamide mononucleotide transporter [Clostridia bacterium]